MSGVLRKPAIAAMSLTIFFAAAIVQTGCGEGASEAPPGQTREAMPADAIADRALKLFANTNPTGDSPYNVISSISLARMLASSDESTKPFLIDTRPKADYDKRHIEGSQQVELDSWAASENLARYPRNKKIIVVHDISHYAGQVTGGLRMLGYDAVTLRGGMSGWAQGFRQAQITQELAGPAYPVDTTPGEVLAAPPAGNLPDAPSDTDYRLLTAKLGSIFGGSSHDAVSAEDLSRKLEADEGSRPFVVDVRQLNDFNIGHISGAVNMPLNSLGMSENLDKLPRDRKIVVVCYQGAVAGQVVAVLRMLDYDAVLLKYGMMGWSGAGKNTFLEYIMNANNPVATSP